MAVLQQRVVKHDEAIAQKILAAGTLGEYQPGDILIEQSAADEFVFFILAGNVTVYVNGRLIGTRPPTEVIGEMSAVNPAMPRTATLRAAEQTVTLRISSADFVAIANAHPAMWRATAEVIAERLRARARFHRPPNAKPIIFVGSSVEGLPIAKHIQLAMKFEPVEVRVWTDGVFGPSSVTVDKLLEQVEQSDFAVFVFGPDDRVASRDENYQAPRDNVIFEMGLFLARLGRDRTYLLKDHKTEIKIPTDLLGIAPITYVADPGAKLEVVLGPAVTEISKKVRELGSL